jgi:hypothetical protein
MSEQGQGMIGTLTFVLSQFNLKNYNEKIKRKKEDIFAYNSTEAAKKFFFHLKNTLCCNGHKNMLLDIRVCFRVPPVCTPCTAL